MRSALLLVVALGDVGAVPFNDRHQQNVLLEPSPVPSPEPEPSSSSSYSANTSNTAATTEAEVAAEVAAATEAEASMLSFRGTRVSASRPRGSTKFNVTWDV